MSKIKFAIIGLGHIGKRHIEMVSRNPEAEVAGVCEMLDPAQSGFNNPSVPYFRTEDELYSSVKDIDVVTVCTPNGLHAPNALRALHEKKHVVIEKPMALTKADCEKIIHKGLQVHKNIFCVMQNRYSPPSAWTKEMMDNKRLGDIYMVQINCYWNRDNRYYTGKNWKGTPDLDGGTLFTQFSHFIDTMYWLFGDITDIQAKFSDFNHGASTAFEDSGIVTFRFLNGGMGMFNYSTSVWDKNLESSMTIIGSKGSIKIGGQYMEKVEYCHIEGYKMPDLAPTNPANDYGAYKGSAQNHHYIIANVIDTLKGRTSITTNALEGMKVVDIIERIYSLRDMKKIKNQFENLRMR